MSGVDLAALRALAAEASEWMPNQPWSNARHMFAGYDADNPPAQERLQDACDPQTVLALVEAVEAAQAYVAVTEDAGAHWIASRYDALEAALAPFRQEQP